jgi:DNA-binding MarR family transcriptional regulator
MKTDGTEGRSFRQLPGSEEAPRRDDLFAFLRYTHIFASTVREDLQLRLLREASPHPLSLHQLNLLKLMCENGKHHVGQMAGYLGVSAPAATKNIDKLERLGLVTRSRSEGDRRTTLLSVSPAGRELVARYERMEKARLGAALDGFDPEEIAAFSRLLERFSVSLLRDEPAGDGSCLRCAAYLEAGCPVGVVRGGCPYHDFRGARRGNTTAAGAP